MIWVTIFGIIVIPIIGYILNQFIVKKSDELERAQKEQAKAFNDEIEKRSKLFFEKLDANAAAGEKRSREDRENVERFYTRTDLYQLAHKTLEEKIDIKFKNMQDKSDDKFTSVMDTMKARFEVIDESIKEVKNIPLN